MSPTSPLGEAIRRQRELSAVSMRRFAELAGISNPYLSQIERGLREPSEKVVEAIADALHTSADRLYEQAGIEPDVSDDGADPSALEAIRADARLTARQRQALIQVYRAFTAGAAPPRRRRRAADGA